MNVKKKPPKVELTIPILHDMELAATKTAEVVAGLFALMLRLSFRASL